MGETKKLILCLSKTEYQRRLARLQEMPVNTPDEAAAYSPQDFGRQNETKKRASTLCKARKMRKRRDEKWKPSRKS
jgi:hypothetical protein